ncbi:MAG: hypothetical protein J1F67_05140 [Muribaculaceae bacterium]|nr:hypothetical protein [Muribaculaceae bacterium]
MRLNKYSETKSGITVGSFADAKASSPGGSGGSTSRTTLDRLIWGQQDNGEDVDGDMQIGGNVFIGEVEYDEDENLLPPPHEFPSEEGNLFASSSVASPEVYGENLFLDINGTKTNLLDLLMPVGSIIMFNGASDIPPNWAVCDGTNGTPNLKDKFIKGVTAKNDVGKTGGSSSVTLSVENMPKHSHAATSSSSGADLDDYKGKLIPALDTVYAAVFDWGGDRNYCLFAGVTPDENGLIGIPIEQFGSTGFSTTIGETGEGKSFGIEPPFYSLIYIMRIK